jgi:hypothetical protein
MMVRNVPEPPGARRPPPPPPPPRPANVVEVRHVADPRVAAELAALRAEVARIREALSARQEED